MLHCYGRNYFNDDPWWLGGVTSYVILYTANCMCVSLYFILGRHKIHKKNQTKTRETHTHTRTHTFRNIKQNFFFKFMSKQKKNNKIKVTI